MKRWPFWCLKLILWELNSFLIQTLSFVPMNCIDADHVSENTGKAKNNFARAARFFVQFVAVTARIQRENA